MQRLGWLALAVVFSILAGATSALAENRIALLIGNQGYSKEIGPLGNPFNDVALLEASLKRLDFDVTVVRDAGLGALTRAVNTHARRLRAAGPNALGFFYYSGHGAADAGTNYLIPIDVKTTETGELWDQSLRLAEITRKLKVEAANATHFVVFDACRNNLKLRQAGSRSIVQAKGFLPLVQENGMLIAYATAEGELASDVGAGAGPYAKVLAEEIVKPGVEAVAMFRRVQVRVRTTIGQEPWLGFSALPEVHLAGIEGPKLALPPAAPELSEAAREWARVDKSSSSELETFIRRHASSSEAEYARARLGELSKPPPTSLVSNAAFMPAAKPSIKPPQTCNGNGIEFQVGNEKRCLIRKQSFKDCPECPEMVVVPSGHFMMGSLSDEEGRFNSETPQHTVTIASAFGVGKFALTRAEFETFVKMTGYVVSESCYTLNGTEM
jgi:uncharacterized caspase-like protein